MTRLVNDAKTTVFEGTISGPLEIVGDSGTGDAIFEVQSADGTVALRVRGDGGDGVGLTQVQASNALNLLLSAAAGVAQLAAPALLFKGVNAAIADPAITPGDFTAWFASTQSEFHLRAKNSGGVFSEIVVPLQHVNPASGTFNADLVQALVAAGLMLP